MIVRIDKSFQKDANKINDPKIKNALVETIGSIRDAQTLSEIKSSGN